MTSFARIQDLLRAFAAPADTQDPALKLLTAPVYPHRSDGRRWAVAGDGRIYVWTRADGLPGFTDYKGSGMPGQINLGLLMLGWTMQPGVPLETTPGAVQELNLSGFNARLAASDVARLRLFDGISVWGGARRKTGSGAITGYNSVFFRAKWGAHTIDGIALCRPERTLRRRPSR